MPDGERLGQHALADDDRGHPGGHGGVAQSARQEGDRYAGGADRGERPPRHHQENYREIEGRQSRRRQATRMATVQYRRGSAIGEVSASPVDPSRT